MQRQEVADYIRGEQEISEERKVGARIRRVLIDKIISEFIL